MLARICNLGGGGRCEGKRISLLRGAQQPPPSRVSERRGLAGRSWLVLHESGKSEWLSLAWESEPTDDTLSVFVMRQKVLVTSFTNHSYSDPLSEFCILLVQSLVLKSVFLSFCLSVFLSLVIIGLRSSQTTFCVNKDIWFLLLESPSLNVFISCPHVVYTKGRPQNTSEYTKPCWAAKETHLSEHDMIYFFYVSIFFLQKCGNILKVWKNEKTN